MKGGSRDTSQEITDAFQARMRIWTEGIRRWMKETGYIWKESHWEFADGLNVEHQKEMMSLLQRFGPRPTERSVSVSFGIAFFGTAVRGTDLMFVNMEFYKFADYLVQHFQ